MTFACIAIGIVLMLLALVTGLPPVLLFAAAGVLAVGAVAGVRSDRT